jgi:hypothetical protein
MRRLLTLLVALAVGLAGAAAPAPAASKKKTKTKTVCVVKIVKSARGKPQRKRVCRKRKVTKRATPGTSARRPTTSIASPRPWIPAHPSAPGGPAVTPAPAAPATPAKATPAPSAPAAPAPFVCEDDSPWLGAVAKEAGAAGAAITLSRTCIRAGKVLVRYQNTDQQPHNLYVRPLGGAGSPRKVVDEIDGATQRDGSVDLTAGQWRFFCTIPGHEMMTRDLDVTPSGT